MAESIYSACYAIARREVAAVRVGVGRGARHEVILCSGVRLPVTYAQATHLADQIWDGVWPDGGKRQSRVRRKLPLEKGAGLRRTIKQSITKEKSL